MESGSLSVSYPELNRFPILGSGLLLFGFGVESISDFGIGDSFLIGSGVVLFSDRFDFSFVGAPFFGLRSEYSGSGAGFPLLFIAVQFRSCSFRLPGLVFVARRL